MSSAPTSRTITLDSGLGCHLLEWNADSDAAHTVVLVHGFLDLSWGWQSAVTAWLHHPEARAELHFVAPDMRGHGDSDRVGTGGYYHFMDYLGDIHSVFAQVGRERVSLVGHSMGGAICSYYAGSFADAVHRLVTMEGLGPPEPKVDMPIRVRNWLASWQRTRDKSQRTYASAEEAAKQLMRHDRLLDRSQALTLARHSTRLDSDGRFSFKHDRAHVTMGPYPFQLELAQQFWNAITCPVLFIEGSESHYRAHSDEVERRLAMFAICDTQQSGARRVESRILEGAGHMMQRHRPVELVAMLDEFIRS